MPYSGSISRKLRDRSKVKRSHVSLLFKHGIVMCLWLCCFKNGLDGKHRRSYGSVRDTTAVGHARWTHVLNLTVPRSVLTIGLA